MSVHDTIAPGSYVMSVTPSELRAFLARAGGWTFTVAIGPGGRMAATTTLHNHDLGEAAEIPTADAYTVAQALFPDDPARVAEIRHMTLSYLAERAGLGGRA